MKLRKFGKYGNTDVIKLKPYDKVDNQWDYGDELNIEDVVKIKENEGSKKTNKKIARKNN